jgi:CRISPR-associated protein Csm5
MKQQAQQHWRLAMTPLSPIHMGTAQDYIPGNYVIENNTLYGFDSASAASVLPPAERSRLMGILSGKADEGMLKQVQGFFHHNRERFIPLSSHWVSVPEGVAAFYQSRVGKVTKEESGGNKRINQLQIERTAYTPTNYQPLLPGSGLKGAIRTALLDQQNAGESWSPKPKNSRELQERLFEYKNFENDPLRLLALGDAACTSTADNGMEILFALNRRRKSGQKGGQTIQSQAEKQGLYQVLECLSPFGHQAFQGQLSINPIKGFEGDRRTPTLLFSAQDIAKACNDFYRPLLQHEIRQMSKLGYLDEDWKRTLDALLDTELGERLDKNQAFLLRVGRHSGAESVTLNGMRSIKIMGQKDHSPQYLDAPKTWWMAGKELQDNRHLRPFGWLLVEMAEYSQALTVSPSMAKVCDDYMEPARQWRRQLDIEIEHARKEQEQEAEVQRLAQQREAELARLSDGQRKLVELSEWLEEDRANKTATPGGRLANRLAVLIPEAATWPQNERDQLADLVEQIYRLIGWGDANRRRERRARIEGLRKTP